MFVGCVFGGENNCKHINLFKCMNILYIIPMRSFKCKTSSGFTLIELSIVLVIIGLIVGGVLVGRDLISSATVRAQIAQIEKLQTAKNTFLGKYGYLPGDVPAPVDFRFGISVGNEGLCNGNGIIDFGAYGGNNGMTGENNMFFINLGETRLIDGTFSFADPNMDASSSRIGNYILPAKIGGGKFIYV